MIKEKLQMALSRNKIKRAFVQRQLMYNILSSNTNLLFCRECLDWKDEKQSNQHTGKITGLLSALSLPSFLVNLYFFHAHYKRQYIVV